MKQILLATALVALPVAVFSGVEHYVVAPPAAASSAALLTDPDPFKQIVTDTQSIAETADLARAATRIADLETLWDKAEPDLRPMDPVAWGKVDAAADAAFAALRDPTPEEKKVETTLAARQSTLADPSMTTGGGAVAHVAGIVVTDEAGHPLPCEVMLFDLRTTLSDGRIASSERKTVADLQSKALEHFNADDDTRADAFAAQALALAN